MASDDMPCGSRARSAVENSSNAPGRSRITRYFVTTSSRLLKPRRRAGGASAEGVQVAHRRTSTGREALVGDSHGTDDPAADLEQAGARAVADDIPGVGPQLEPAPRRALRASRRMSAGDA